MSSLHTLFEASPTARLDDQPPEGALDEAAIREQAGAVSGLQRVALGCILLRHGHLEPGHVEAQAISGPYGDWLHAIMHRMEGDYGNCRYWCRQAGGEEHYAAIEPGFTPAELTDRVERLERDFDSAAAAAARALQARELAVLFTHCAA
jgi:hypothetical protein